MSNKKKLKIIIQIAIVIIAIIVLYIGLAIIDNHIGDTWFSSSENEALEDEDLGIYFFDEPYEVTKDVKTYLFIGTDISGDLSIDGELYQGNMADFLVLVVIDENEKTYSLLPINRDTIASVDILLEDGTSYASAQQQICTAQWYGKDLKESCNHTVNMVSKLLHNIKIDGYYAISMKDIGKLNEAVGGVRVMIEDDFSSLDATMVKGQEILLNNEQAELFVRSRMAMSNDSNAERMRRQQVYLKSFMESVKQKTASNSEFGVWLYQEMEKYSTSSISGKLVGRIIKNADEYENLGFFHIDGETKLEKSTTDNKEHACFYMDEESLFHIIKELYSIEKLDE